MPHFLDLATETILHIVGYVTDGDLKNLRLTCKELCDAATRPFTIAYFTERHHVASAHSIKTLVKITAHPVFGSHIEAICISAAVPLNVPASFSRQLATLGSEKDRERPVDPTNTDRFVASTNFLFLMEQVFANIKSHMNTVTLEICDERPMPCFGWHALIDDSWSLYTYDMANTLEQTCKAVRAANCEIRSLRVSFWQYYWTHCMDPYFKLLQLVVKELPESVSGSANESFAVSILGRGGYLDLDAGLRYFRESQRTNHVEIFGCLILDHGVQFRDCTSPILWCTDWVLPFSPTRLEIRNCDSYRPYAFFDCIGQACANTLESIHLSQISLKHLPGMRPRWSRIFQRLSSMLKLKKCEFSCLQYQPKRNTPEVLDPKIRCMEYFRLSFPNREDKFVVEGDDVSAKLEHLAVSAEKEEEARQAAWERDHPGE